MRARVLFLVMAVLAMAPLAKAAEIYSTDCWEIAGPSDRVTWLVIQNREEAAASGIAHVCVLARKKGAPAWSVEWVCNHIAITTEALQRSVIRPSKSRGAYPERYEEALRRWQEEAKTGKAAICSTSIAEWLKAHP